VEMRDEAERYCSLIERAETFEREAFAAALAESLAGLLSAASQLPAVSPTEVDLPEGPPEEEWSERFAAVQRVLGEWEGYWTTTATDGDGADEAVMLPLGDDLADIWRALKRGLLALADGAPPDDVAWEWRFGFYTHWGRHATEALRALHARLADDGGPIRDGDER
jgi:hypothetical protein